VTRFRFRFASAYRIAGAPFGVTSSTTMVEVAHDRFRVRFGPWLLDTALDNVTGCSVTGPYGFAKTAGPAHLSLADHGLTCATNGERGLCVHFAEPVAGIDPFGRLRHPAVTVTVERIDDLERLLTGEADQDERERIEAAAPGVAGQSPWEILRRWARWPGAIGLGTLRYFRMLPDVRRTHREEPSPAPLLDDPDDVEELQPIHTGVGPTFERRYRARIRDAATTPEELMERIVEDFNRSANDPITEFVDQRVTEPRGDVGSEYRIQMPGPWDGPVRVVDRTPTSIRLATLGGHMEAGQIEMRVDEVSFAARGGRHDLVFEIHSIARSGDSAFHVLYEGLGIAREMQLYVWVDLCRNVCALSGGTLDGKIEVDTTKYRAKVERDATGRPPSPQQATSRPHTPAR
jgi:hypothetical protein